MSLWKSRSFWIAHEPPRSKKSTFHESIRLNTRQIVQFKVDSSGFVNICHPSSVDGLLAVFLQIDFQWVESTLRKMNRAIWLESSICATLPSINSLLAVFVFKSIANRLPVSWFDFHARWITQLKSNQVDSSTFATLTVYSLLAVFFLSFSQIDFWWVKLTFTQDESRDSSQVQSSTFATLPSVDSFISLFFRSLSLIDFQWVDSTFT